MSALTCGLDVHKDWTDVTVRRNMDGEIAIGVRKLPNKRTLGFLKKHPDISRVAMEASTSVVPLYRDLKEAGYNDVLVSHPKKARLIAESVIESDRVDSEAISELARMSALPLAYIPPPEIAKVRRRAFLVRIRTKLKNKVMMQLLYEGIKEPEENEYGLFTKKGVSWLSSLSESRLGGHVYEVDTQLGCRGQAAF